MPFLWQGILEVLRAHQTREIPCDQVSTAREVQQYSTFITQKNLILTLHVFREELTGENSLDIVDSSDTVRNLSSYITSLHVYSCAINYESLNSFMWIRFWLKRLTTEMKTV